ncbi:MAG: hypothetical protein ACXACF_00045 [Candidatus Hermodarchaeia archaeon]|jgi:hypothetical protein
MLKIATAEKVNIYAPKESYISFFNSPYYAHRENLAIDIYPTRDNPPITAYSPVTGRIKKIYTFNPPTPKFFNGPSVEHLIILGKAIAIGDELGTIVRSGFYHFWTAPHLHVEVRKKANLIRAKGSEPIIPTIEETKTKDNRLSNFATFEVTLIEKNYGLLKSGEDSKIGRIYGIGCTVGSDWGILDGGIPHYPFGGVYLRSMHSVKVGDSVKLGSIILGTVRKVFKNLAFFKRRSLIAYINETRIRGISVFLNFITRKVIKIIPMIPNQFQLVTGDTAQLTFQVK